MSSNRRSALMWLAAASLGGPAGTWAQSGKPLRLLVGFAPGGALDVVAREIGEGLRSAGYNAIIDNRAGASGRLATEQLLAAPPDGATLVFMPGGNATIFPHVYPTLKYDPFKDLVPVAAACEFSFALAAGPGTPAKTLKEFIDWAKANPGKANYATPGGGTAMHFMGVMLGRAAGFEFTHIPYRGGAAAMIDAIGGTVATIATTVPNALQPHKQGKVRILAISGAQRLPALPGVPTFIEAGFPQLEIIETFGFFAHAKTPPAVLAELHSALRGAVTQTRVTAALEKLEFDPLSLSQAGFAARLKTDFERWGPVIKSTGYRADD
jgi:tripartite-type tricarboxylate transporter receptor subunit TctC